MTTSPRHLSLSNSGGRRAVTFFLVALLHAGLIFGPLWMFDLFEKRKPKENMFRVKIGGAELSRGPETGMPERTPPPPPAPPRPAVPEPGVPPPPQKRVPAEPRIPVVKPKPKPVVKPKPKPVVKPKPKPVVKPKPKPKPVVKPKPKPVVKPKPKPVVKPKPKPVVKPKPKSVVKPKPKSVVKPKPKPVVKPRQRDPHDDVYRDPNPPNLNPKVPVGSRNRAQQYASKADNKTPGGGKKVDEAAWRQYGTRVERYIYSRWVEPPRSLLGNSYPETVVDITIEADGKVSAAKIVKSSGSRPMESSVEILLKNLDLLPRPPEGPTVYRIILKTR